MMIQLTNIEKSFGTGAAVIHALQGVNLSIASGEMLAIMGKSGSGKSTPLNVLGGLIAFDAGEYLYQGNVLDLKNRKQALAFRRNEVGVVLQYFALLDDRNVYANVALPLQHQGLNRRETEYRVKETLALLEMSEKENAFPNELSGGQQQRVAIARAMVKKPKLLLADEPTGALDEETERVVMGLFQKLHALGNTVVIVTHDDTVANCCERIVVLKNGKFEP